MCYFFKAGSKQILVRIIGLSKKCFAFVFSGKGLDPQNIKERTKKKVGLFAIFSSSFLPDFLKYFLECQHNQNSLNLNANFIYF